MIGEVVRLSFDGSAVHRGIGGVMKGFTGLSRGIGRVTRQIGIGAARQMGASIFGTVLTGLRAIPNELGNLSALSKEMSSLGSVTGVTSKEFLALRDAISKTTILDVDEATELIFDVKERMGEVLADGNSTPRKALHSMGLFVKDIQGKTAVDQIKTVARAYKEMREAKGDDKAMFAITELLGDQAGKKMTPLFNSFNTAMKDSRESTKGLASDMEALKGELQGVDLITTNFRRKMSELALGSLKAFSATGGSMKGIADYIDNIDITKHSTQISGLISSVMKGIKDQGLLEYLKTQLKSLGAYLQEIITNAIKDGVKGAMPSLSPMQWLKGGAGSSKAPSGFNMLKGKLGGAMSTAGMETQQERTNKLLEDISTNGIVGRYA